MKTKIINDFDNLRLINQDNIFDYIPMGHPHRPASPALLFVINGSVKLKENITVFDLKANSLVFIDSDRVYEVLVVGENTEVVLLGFKSIFLQKISFKINKVHLYNMLKAQLKRDFMLPLHQMQLMVNSLDQIKLYESKKDELKLTDEIIEHYFITILLHIASIVENNIKERHELMTKGQRMVNQFILLVSDNYLKHKNVQYYSEKLEITNRYMSSVIKKETGKTPQDFIAEFIVNESKAQLSSTTKDIKEIAEYLKFSDQYSFSHFFKKHLNISPTAYRKQFY